MNQNMKNENPPTQSRAAFDEKITSGVSILRGDPKIAIRKLSGPMIIAMLMMAIYNLADAIWVAGLGSDALAAIGFVTPLFMAVIGLSNGLGAGATSVVARRIGARNKAGADSAAMHSIISAVAISLVLTPVLVLAIGPIVALFGAGAVVDLAVEYGSIVFFGTFFILFAQVSYAILRAEGDTRRTMYAMGASSLLNIVLDPILIYGAGLGVAGAALATVISMASVAVILLYWFLVKKDTYVSLYLHKFSFERRTTLDIFGVGLPASVEFLLMSVVVIVVNAMLVRISGTDAVAIYTSGWRIVMFAVVPLVGITTSLVSVVGAAYGALQYEKIRIAHLYAIRIGVVIAVIISILTWIFASQISGLFTYSAESAHLLPGFIIFFHTITLFYPFVPLSMMSSSVFQGTGHGLTSLLINLMRNLLFIVLFAYLLGIVLGFGVQGIWFGIVSGNILAGIVGFSWAYTFISRLIASGSDPNLDSG